MSTTPRHQPSTKASSSRSWRWLGTLTLIAVLAFTACDSNDEATDEEPNTTVAPAATVAAPATTEATTTTAAPSATDARLHLTFDGESCTLDGPETLQPGPTTLTLENTHDDEVNFTTGHLTDPSLTLEEVKAWYEANPNERSPWEGGFDFIGMVMAGQVLEYPYVFSEGIYEIATEDPTTEPWWTSYTCGAIEVASG